MKEFWNNPITEKYLFYSDYAIDSIVEKYGECKNDYVIKIEYFLCDRAMRLGGKFIVDCTKEDFENFVYDANNMVLSGWEINYNEFEDIFCYDGFEKNLKNEIVPNSQSDFIKLVNDTFFTFKFESQAIFFFRELIFLLSKAIVVLKQIEDELYYKTSIQFKPYNSIEKIVANVYSESLVETIQIIKTNYKFIFPEIENNFDLDFKLHIDNFLIKNDSNKYQKNNKIISKIKLQKNIFQFVQNIEEKDKEAFLNEIKKTFSTEKGIKIRIIIDFLKNEQIILIQDGDYNNFIEVLKLYFNRNIGTYQSIQNIKHIDDLKKEPIEKKLKSLVIKYKINQ